MTTTFRLPVLGALLACVPTLLHAQAGTLDPTFGDNGVASVDLGDEEFGEVMALQPDGKIVVAGYTQVPSGFDMLVVRFNGDGSLDTDFGTGGSITADLGGDFDEAVAVTILDDGKILVAAIISDGGPDQFDLLRYNSDGTLDASFALSGNSFVGYPGEAGMVVQPDGRIVLGGFEIPNHMELARYNGDGTIDDAFGTNGVTDFLYGSGYSAVAMHGDAIVAGGDGVDMRIAQFDATGHLDQAFGTNGTQAFDFGGNEGAHALLVQSDGKVVSGGSNGLANADMALARCNADGSPDAGFGTDGKVITDIGGGIDAVTSLAQDADGRLLAAGIAFYGGYGTVGLVRYNSDGSLDTGFGIGGIVEETVGADDRGNAVAVQPDGKILVGGASDYIDSYDVVVLRYEGSAPESLEETHTPQPMAVHPNPSGGEITVSGTSGRGRISVYDMMGRTVLASRAEESRTRMDVSSLVPGEYVLIHDEDGRCQRLPFAKR